MQGHEIEVPDGATLVKVVRALGKHRYVATRMHLLHAFAIEAASAYAIDPALGVARAWAEAVMRDPAIDRGSRDERLYRRSSEAELVATLDAFWANASARAEVHARLLDHLATIGVDPAENGRLPFDEAHEDDVFPILIDAGWELLPLASLDPERHKGAIAAFGDALAWEVARFEEQNEVPSPVYLHELPVLGAVELLAAVDDALAVTAPFVVWASGPETYLDYVLRGVTKVAGIAREA
jgi:hypothetical protein